MNNIVELDFLFNQLVKEASSRETRLQKRLEIRKQLTVIRRLKRTLKEREVCSGL